MKKYIFFTVSFIVFLCSYIACSEGASTSVEANATVFLKSNEAIVEVGKETGVYFGIEGASTVSFLTSIFYDDDKFEYISGPNNATVKNGEIKVLWYDSKGGEGAETDVLGKLIFKAKKEGIANFVIDGAFYDETGEKIQTDFQNAQIEVVNNIEQTSNSSDEGDIKPNNANLQSLRLDAQGLVPEFKKDIYEYDLTIPSYISNIDIIAVPENISSKVEIIGNNELKNGLNIIKIKVTSKDGTKSEEYKINVTKTENVELANANLEILAIEDVWLNPAFNKLVTKYNAEVSEQTKSLKILAVGENEKATVNISGGENLVSGNNLITVTVTAPNGITKRVYKINVYKRNSEEEIKYNDEQDDLEENLPEEVNETYVDENLDSNEEDVGDVEDFEDAEIKQKQNKNSKYILIVKIFFTIIISTACIILAIKLKKLP